jgi:hypothetical protein
VVFSLFVNRSGCSFINCSPSTTVFPQKSSLPHPSPPSSLYSNEILSFGTFSNHYILNSNTLNVCQTLQTVFHSNDHYQIYHVHLNYFLYCLCPPFSNRM